LKDTTAGGAGERVTLVPYVIDLPGESLDQDNACLGVENQLAPDLAARIGAEDGMFSIRSVSSASWMLHSPMFMKGFVAFRTTRPPKTLARRLLRSDPNTSIFSIGFTMAMFPYFGDASPSPFQKGSM
jgi:hypothetical protein